MQSPHPLGSQPSVPPPPNNVFPPSLQGADQQSHITSSVPSSYAPVNSTPTGNGIGVGVGVGQLLLRLAHMHEMLMRRPQKASMDFWRLFVAEFFHEHAQFRYLVTLANQQHRVFMMGAETLPRLFHVIYNSGIAQQSVELQDPREYAGVDSTYTLSAREARWRMESESADSIVELHGTFKVTFVPVPPSSAAPGGSQRPRHSLKIVFWEFDRQFQREYLAPSSRNQGPAPAPDRPRLVNEYGLPPLVMRCFEIADILLYMNDLMRFSVRQNITSPQETLERYCAEVIRVGGAASSASSNASNYQQFHSASQAGLELNQDASSYSQSTSADAGAPRRTSGRKRKRPDNSYAFDDDDDDDDKDEDGDAPPRRRPKKQPAKTPSSESTIPSSEGDLESSATAGRGRGRKKAATEASDGRRRGKKADDAEYTNDDFDE